MRTVRDCLWMWGHEAGSHNGGFGVPGASRMTPAEAALYLNVPNLLIVVFGGKPEPPFDRHTVAMRPFDRVVWSIIGDSGSRRNDELPDTAEVGRLAARFPNITGAIMDDFFADDASGARRPVEALHRFRDELEARAGRHLDLWVVVYDRQLDRPLQPYLEFCDVITFWTWRARDLPKLADNFAALEHLAPARRKVLGCYLWDYGDQKPMPVQAMEQQCEQGLEWLRQGRIEGMIFLASCICDLELDAVEWTRDWVRRVGGQALG